MQSTCAQARSTAKVGPWPTRGAALLLKRQIDVAVAGVALIVLSPVLLLIAALVRWDSSGPALFRQTRMGLGGRRFDMWKFRTMKHGESDEPHRKLIAVLQGRAPEAAVAKEGTPRPVYKLVDDPRVTRIGQWLRRTSLDELPQLFNVLCGDMSLVGPRPPVTYECDGFESWQHERMMMPQGMTGLWQVSGRSRLSYQRMCELDIQYVRNWSLWLDLKILARTILTILRRRATA
jgi:lipopolysaccharide/colanic/teichoic acid biosynthesis glycosyltransferase